MGDAEENGVPDPEGAAVPAAAAEEEEVASRGVWEEEASAQERLLPPAGSGGALCPRALEGAVLRLMLGSVVGNKNDGAKRRCFIVNISDVPLLPV